MRGAAGLRRDGPTTSGKPTDYMQKNERLGHVHHKAKVNKERATGKRWLTKSRHHSSEERAAARATCNVLGDFLAA